MEVVCCWFYVVLFFDEVEKVYFDVFNLLLQVLDDGWFIDFQGCIVDFCYIVVVMISNLVSLVIFEYVCLGLMDELVL